MWEPQPLTTLRASKACRGENFTLQHINQRLHLLSLIFRTALPGRRILTSVFLSLCWTLDSGIFLSLSLSLSLSLCLSESSRIEYYVTTDGQSASVSWNKAPIWGLGPDFYYCLTVAGLLMWGALSHERSGLSFTIAAGPHQRTNSQVRVPWDSRPYFTASNSRLPFSSPPTTRRRCATPPPHGILCKLSQPSP
jgi:hypothetical protein